MVRVDSKKVRSNTIQALASAGCLSMFNLPRKAIFLYCSDYRKKLQSWMKKHDPNKETFVYPFNLEDEWTISELYALEHHYIGDAFVCKPPVAYGNFFNVDHVTVKTIKDSEHKTKLVPIRGILRSFFEFKVKKEKSKYYGMSMIKAIIEDKNGEQCSCTIFPDRWNIVQQRLKSGKIAFEPGLAISFGGTCNAYEDDMGIVLEDLFAALPCPRLPSDLKAKKTSMRKPKEDENKKSVVASGVEEMAEEIEDQLYDEGLIDLSLDDEFTDY